jgi:branched-chain amino acid transport system substrate-binding protein
MLNKRLNKGEWLYLALSLVVSAAIYLQISAMLSHLTHDFFCKFDTKSLDCQKKLISFGERSIISPKVEKNIKRERDRQEFSYHKQKGIEFLKNASPVLAADEFNKAFIKYPDPETLIYKNNAAAATQPNLQIVVSVPASQNPEIAEEILRGVAQAQDEVNQKEGINGQWLQVGIADDKNNKTAAQEIANEAVNNTKIMAVVGHNASTVSQAVAGIYEKDNLVMVTPTSYSLKLSSSSPQSSIFKIVPNVDKVVNQLQTYYTQTAHKSKLFICSDSSDDASKDVKYFFESIKEPFQTVSNDKDCDVSRGNFSIQQAIAQAKNKKADSLLLATPTKKIDLFIKIAKEAKEANSQLALFSSPTLYTQEILRQGGASVKDMVLVTPWHPDAFPENPFPSDAQRYWKAQVNWRTAMAYDATKVIIEGLRQSNSNNRQALRDKLHEIQVCGATDKISFKSTGERNETPVFLIKVAENNKSDTAYDFELISTSQNNYKSSCSKK